MTLLRHLVAAVVMVVMVVSMMSVVGLLQGLFVVIVGGGVEVERLSPVVAVLGRRRLDVVQEEGVVVEHGVHGVEGGRGGAGKPHVVAALDAQQVPGVTHQSVLPVRPETEIWYSGINSLIDRSIERPSINVQYIYSS